MKNVEFQKAIRQLDKALASKRIDDLLFDAICKRFEVCFEYAWKHLKRLIVESGEEVYSPKDVLRESSKQKHIENLDLWLDFLQERNLSVHNYYSGNPEATLEIIRKFSKEVKKIHS